MVQRRQYGWRMDPLAVTVACKLANPIAQEQRLILKGFLLGLKAASGLEITRIRITGRV